MQIVIDIDEDEYKARQRWVANPRALINAVDKAIANGIPLPKGHGKLIDSNVLWDAFQDLGQDFYEAFDFAEANAVIEADEEDDTNGND